VERAAVSLARQGDAVGAMKELDALDHRRAELLRSLARQRAAIARARQAAFKTWLADERGQAPVPASAKKEAAPSAHVEGNRRPRAAHPSRPAAVFPHPSGVRPCYTALRSEPASGQHPEPHPFVVQRATARATLRPPRSLPVNAAARARAEIAVQFAHRWAAIRRMPPEERAAAAAALHAEQEAALAARTRHLIGEHQQERRAERARLAVWHQRFLRCREVWVAAATMVAARRPLFQPRRPPMVVRGVAPPASTGI
jgi:hypothetical protein